MRRWLAYLLVWSVGTAATVGACWLGLRSVVDAAVPRQAAPFSAAELGRATPSPGSPAGSTTPAGNVAAAVEVPPVQTTSPAPSTSPAPPASPTPTGAADEPVWEPVSNGRGGTAYRRTFRLLAGDITFYCDSRDVHVVDARPEPGYTLVSTRYDYRSLMVSMISTDRRSRVYVSWRGRPYAEITETVA